MTSPSPVVTLEPLSPERLDDLMAFFETRAFVDHPSWRPAIATSRTPTMRTRSGRIGTAAQNKAATCARCDRDHAWPVGL